MAGRSVISARQIAQAQRREHGTGSRSRTPGLKPKDLIGQPWMLAFALRADGWYLRADIIWEKPNPIPESVRDRPTKAHEYVFLLSKSPRYHYDAEAISALAEKGAAGSRFDSGKTGIGNSSGHAQSGYRDSEQRNARSVWTIATQPFSEWRRTAQADRVPSDAGGDGILRITSPDCREHGGRADLVPSRFCGEREVFELIHSLGTDVHPDQAPAPGSEQAEKRRVYCSWVESQDSDLLGSAQPATPRSNGESKTARAPATSSPCSASAQSRNRTGDSGEEPDPFDSAERIPENSNAEGSAVDALAIARDQIGRRNAGKCTCLYYRITIQEMSHFATFPEELARRCILAGCPAGGTVLDPFAGSGTVGQVAQDLGHRALLIEANRDYVALIHKRCAQRSLLTEFSA
jgi:hypothetical protein